MKNYRLVIFETNKKDGCMSLAKKFYPEDYTDKERRKEFNKVKEKVGKKYHFNGKHILQPQQKDVELEGNYPDGTYVRITENYLTKEDYWDEKIPCDILVIDTKFPNIVIGHRMADCPIIIAEDTKNQVVAVSHCGASQINREVPKWTIEALKKEAHSNPQNIHVYIGSCIKKNSYQYDCYPHWATNDKVWKDCIHEVNNVYYIDLIHAIKKQLDGENILDNNIKESPTDTYLSPDYYSHTEEKRNPNSIIGQNFVGCFYQEESK